MSIAKTGGNFLDSEIMRSLEKVAIKRGLVEPEPMEKTAAAPQQLKTSGDLHADLISLVASLRERGYEAEADSLEDKVHVYKMAKDKYKKLCDEELVDSAHPEGDAEVAPSAEDYGKVETITSTQKKILDKVRKMPTGKLASAANQMRALLKQSKAGWADKSKYMTSELISKGDSLIMQSATHAKVKTFVAGLIDGDLVDEVNWKDEAEGWGDDSESSYVASKLQPILVAHLKKWVRYGWEPISHLSYLNQSMSFNRSSVASGGELDVHSLWQEAGGSVGFVAGAKSGKIKLFPEVAAKVEAAKKEEVEGSGKEARGHGVSYESLNGKATALRNIRGKDDIHENNREKARELENHTNKLVQAIKNSKTYPKLRALLKNLMPNVEWEKYKDSVDIKRLLRKEEGAIQQWIDVLDSKESYKKADRLDALRKLAQTTPPPSNEDKKTVPKADYLGLQIQKELKALADAYEKRGGNADYASQMRDTGAPGFGGQVREALSYAEKVREEVGAKDVAKIEQQRSQATLASLQKLRAHLEKGSGQLGRPAGSVGVYKKESGEQIPVTKSDVMSAWHFYNWALENGELDPEDYQGEPVFNMQKFTDVILKVRNSAAVQVQNATDRQDRKAKLYFLRAITHVAKDYTNAAMTSGATKQGPDGKQPTTMRVADLKSSGAPGGSGQAGHAGSGKRPYGVIPTDEDGMMTSPMQIEFIDMKKPGSIGGLPAKEYPPITRWIDLSNAHWWDMPETDQLDFKNWETADPRSLAGSMFGDVGSWPPHIQKSVGQSLQQNAAAIQQNPEIANKLYGQAALAAFRDFMRRLGANISKVRAAYSDSVETPEARRQLISRSDKDAQQWIKMLQEKENRLMRGGRSRRRRRY